MFKIEKAGEGQRKMKYKNRVRREDNEKKR
jgi:hypothetical protein